MATDKTQVGSALPIGMVLLLILTLLGVAGMNASRMELAMAGGLQNMEYTAQAAEAGIERAMAENPPAQGLVVAPTNFNLPGNANDTANVTYQLQWRGLGPPPMAGSTYGEVTAHFFEARSTATLNSNGQSQTHVQGYFVMAPGG